MQSSRRFPAVEVTNAGRVLAEHYGGQLVESCAIPDPSNRHDHGGLDSPRWQASKHSVAEGGEAQAGLLSPEGQQAVL